MHKGEFYAILPKDAQNIKCTVEVFKKKSARPKSKPRTVSFQGREDDVTLPMETNVSLPEKYIMPAKRIGERNQAMLRIAPETLVLQIDTMTFQIVP